MMGASQGLATEGPSLVRHTMEYVQRYICENGLKVGDSLPGEGVFAAELDVSRAVMREAFGALAALRVIDVANGRRARIAAIDGSVLASSLGHAVSTDQIGIGDIWEVRRTIEARTAALAASHRTDAEAARIVDLGRIDIHRIQIMAAAMWVKARKCGARRS